MTERELNSTTISGISTFPTYSGDLVWRDFSGIDYGDYATHYTTNIHYGISCPSPTKGIGKHVSIPVIKGIYPQGRLVVVKFTDNSIVKLNCHEEDEFDVEIAAALAIAYKVYGSKGEFRRQVEKISGIKKGDK